MHHTLGPSRLPKVASQVQRDSSPLTDQCSGVRRCSLDGSRILDAVLTSTCSLRVSVLKTTRGCGLPRLCSWLCHEVLNNSVVCNMMHQSDGQRGSAWMPHSQNRSQNSHAYAVDYPIRARRAKLISIKISICSKCSEKTSKTIWDWEAKMKSVNIFSTTVSASARSRHQPIII